MRRAPTPNPYKGQYSDGELQSAIMLAFERIENAQEMFGSIAKRIQALIVKQETTDLRRGEELNLLLECLTLLERQIQYLEVSQQLAVDALDKNEWPLPERDAPAIDLPAFVDDEPHPTARQILAQRAAQQPQWQAPTPYFKPPEPTGERLRRLEYEAQQYEAQQRRETGGQVILAQLGGPRAITMIGAKDILVDSKLLQFGFKAKATNGANKVRITLDPTDTYAVEFWKVRGTSAKKISKHEEIYADNLRPLFERETGLYLRM